MRNAAQGRASGRGPWAGLGEIGRGALIGLGLLLALPAGAAVTAADRATTKTVAVAARPAAPAAAPMAAPVAALSEHDKIEALLRRVEASGLIFIRNGSEYPAAKAASHLRMKWDYAGDRIKTARQFIDYLATRSSRSGKPYQVRLPNGQTLAAGDWLSARLAELEAPPKAARAAGAANPTTATARLAGQTPKS
jgi:hypothetical protein